MKIEKDVKIYIGRHVFQDEVPDKFVTDALRKRQEIKAKEEKKEKKKKDKE